MTKQEKPLMECEEGLDFVRNPQPPSRLKKGEMSKPFEKALEAVENMDKGSYH